MEVRQVVALVGTDTPSRVRELDGGGGDGRDDVKTAFARVVSAQFTLGTDGHGRRR